MAYKRSIISRTAVVVIIAATLALLCAGASFEKTQQASAQSYITCPNGQVYPSSVGYQFCSNSASGYVVCNGNAVPANTSCSPSGTQYCGTSVVPPGSYCCPNGNVIPIGAMCTTTGPQYCGGTVVPAGEYCCPNGNAIPIGAMCTNTTPQYCGATVIPSGDYCCPNGNAIPIGAMCTNTGPQYCDGSVLPFSETCCGNGSIVPLGQPCGDSGGTICGSGIVYYPQTCQTESCPNGTVAYSPNSCPVATACPGGSYAYSPDTCSSTVACSNGTFVYAPNSCPTNQVTYCAGGVTVAAGQQCPSETITSPASTGLTVSYSAGWNLVGGPTGTVITGNVGPLYAFRAGDSSYEVVPSGTPLTAGSGYWAYFSQSTTSSLGTSGMGSMTAQLPAGQFVMVGNPGTSTARVSGADILYTYSVAGGYQQVTTLAPGQGAWAFSANGAVVSITTSTT